jgi:hypothetical protein
MNDDQGQQGRTIVSVSDNTDICEGWRVRCYFLPDNWNALGRTLVETYHKTDASARKAATAYAQQYGAELSLPHNSATRN